MSSHPFPFRLRDLRSPAATQRLSLGCPHLDALLGGGIPVGCLTEVVGESTREEEEEERKRGDGEQLNETRRRTTKTHLSRPGPLFKNKNQGEATAGKTQLCLRLLLTAQLPEDLGGLDGSALWLCSEKGDPPARRLAQLAKNGNNRPSSSLTSSASALASPSHHHAAPPSTDNVFVEKGLATPLELMEALDRMEPLMMATAATANANADGNVGGGKRGLTRRRRIRLVVIDSIAALFRDAAAAMEEASGGGAAGGGGGGKEQPLGGGGSGRSLYVARAAALFAVASRLKRLADDHQLVIVVVNQVTDVISDGQGEDFGGIRPPSALSSSFSPSSSSSLPTHTAGLRLVSSGREVAPALGLAWASCVGIRLFLSRAAPVGSSFGGGGNNDNENLPQAATAAATMATATRRLQVVFAPHLPSSSCLATVDERGLVGVVASTGEKGEGKRHKEPPLPAAPQPVVVVCSGVFADDGP